MTPRLVLVGLLLACSRLAQAGQAQAPEAAPLPHDDHAVETKAPEASKKKPTVSRVTTPAVHPPAAATATATAKADDHAPKAAASEGGHSGGYVATGARATRTTASGPAKAAGKAKPIVSGATAPSAESHASDAAHDESPAGKPAPSTSGGKAAAGDHHASPATSEHDAAEPAAAPAPATPRAAPRGLARLSDVHERIAAALASLRDDGREPAARRDDDGDSGALRTPRPPRITLTWPGPRWRVTWPVVTAAGLAAGQSSAASVASSTALHAMPAPALPTPLPAAAKPPDRH